MEAGAGIGRRSGSPIIATTARWHQPFRSINSGNRPCRDAAHRICGYVTGNLYDVFGSGFALLRFDPTVDISGVVRAAAHRGVPMVAVEVDVEEVAASIRTNCCSRAPISTSLGGEMSQGLKIRNRH